MPQLARCCAYDAYCARAIWKPGEITTSGRGAGAAVGTYVVAAALRPLPTSIVTSPTWTAYAPSCAGSTAGAPSFAPSVAGAASPAGAPSAGARASVTCVPWVPHAARATSRTVRAGGMALLHQAVQRG